MKIMLLVVIAGAILAGTAHAQSGPTSPAQAHARLNAVVGGSGFYDGWAMHLPSPRTTDFKPGASVRSDSECVSVVLSPEGEVRFDWRQVARIRSSSSLRPIGSPMGDRISLYFMEALFGESSPALRLFFRSTTDRDSAMAAARFLGQRCNPGGVSLQD